MPDPSYDLPDLDRALRGDSLRARLAELVADGLASRLMDEAHAKVAAWSWTAQYYGGGERVEPFWRERHDLGARVKETPGRAPVSEGRVAATLSPDDRIRKSKTFREFGRDSQGRLIVTRLVCDDPTSAWAWHLGRDGGAAEVWISDTESVQAASTGTSVRSVRRTSWADDRIVASASYSEHGGGATWHAEYYSYDGGVLDSIRVWDMHHHGSDWSVWPHPAPMRFWTVERGGKAIRQRPANGSTPPQLSEQQLDALQHEYLIAAATSLPPMAELAWRHYAEWAASNVLGSSSEHPVCLINIPGHSSGLPNLLCLRILTADERNSLRGRPTYKSLAAYLKPEGAGIGVADFSNELKQADFLGKALSDELHRRRDDERFECVVRDLLARLRDHDWSRHFPTTDDLVIASIDEEGPLKRRRAQLERSIGSHRFATLEQTETAVANAAKAASPPITISRAKRALLATIRANHTSAPGTVPRLWEAFSQFVAIPIDRCEPDTDGDLILVEWTTSGDECQLSFVRQLTPEGPDGEYVGMHTVRLDIALPAKPELAGIADGNTWLRHTDLKNAGESVPVLKAASPVTAHRWDVHAGPI